MKSAPLVFALAITVSLTQSPQLYWLMAADFDSSDAVAALNRLESAYQQLQCEGIRSFKSGVNQRVHRFQAAFDGPFNRLVETVTSDTFPRGDKTLGVTTALVASTSECFRLERRDSAENYRTVWMGSGQDPAVYKRIQETVDTYFHMIRRPYCLPGGISLSALLAHPSFAAKTVTKTKLGDFDCIRIDFAVRPSKESNDPLVAWCDAGPLTGFVVTRPSKQWAIQEYQVDHVESGLTVSNKGSVSYQLNDSPFPLLRKAENETSVKPRVTSLEVFTVESLKLEAPARSAFSVEDFGLADPAKSSVRVLSATNSIWLIGAIGLLATLAFWLLGRRRCRVAKL